jgi:hypothetical protein
VDKIHQESNSRRLDGRRGSGLISGRGKHALNS